MIRCLSKYSFVVLLAQLSFFSAYGQINRGGNFNDIILKIDTNKFTLNKNLLYFQGNKYISFKHSKPDEICEINIYPQDFESIQEIQLVKSSDFEILDSLFEIDREYYRGKIRFNDLTKSSFLNFTLRIKEKQPAKEYLTEIKLFPYAITTINFRAGNEDLYIGEEKVFELTSNYPRNIHIERNWTNGQDIDYRLSEKDGQIRLHVLPNKIGTQKLSLKVHTLKPFLNDYKDPTYELPLITHSFNVKNSRLAFLNVDKKDVTLEEASQKGIDIQLDNNRNLEIGKTYRIENNEAPGSTFIGEIFTRNRLSNEKVLCFLRVFNYHKNTEGYLYLKDGDKAQFVTNFSISPKTRIEKVSILREGADWTENTSVFPGESIEVKIEGQSLDKARFYFEDIAEIKTDSAVVNEHISVHKLKIPVSFSKRKISILNHKENTGYALLIREYQEPRPLDFVMVDYGDGKKAATEFNKPILYPKAIKDLVISFKPDQIDSGKKFYGKQYLKIEVKILNNRKELIEIKTFDNILICPEGNSPRIAFYSDKNCTKNEINLNRQIYRKTYDLEDWSKIEVTISHDPTKYGGNPGFTQRVEVFLSKTYRFDIDVSFPAGLLYQKTYTGSELEVLWGISTAVIAQISFYQPDRIARLQPYRIGIGFIALNAFNFNADASNRDVGLVILGSLYPTRKDVKLTFPLHFGYGYMLKEGKRFTMLGPGIQLRF